MNEVRIDKYLWAMRLFKTRTIAADACKNGRIFMGDGTIKASRSIKVGDIITVKRGQIMYSFKALQLTANRLNAKLVADYIENVTPKEEYDKLEMMKIAGFGSRDRGTGRPTKKDRRDIDEFIEDSFNWFDED